MFTVKEYFKSFETVDGH